MGAIDAATEALRTRHLADVGHLLAPAEQRELEGESARLQAAGLPAHIVVTPAGEDLGPWYAVWTRLGYGHERDLLLLFNGRRWEARGWNLGGPAIVQALAAAEPALKQSYGKGLKAALVALATATGVQRPEPGGARWSTGRVMAGLAAAAALGLLGWGAIRRRQRARRERDPGGRASQ